MPPSPPCFPPLPRSPIGQQPSPAAGAHAPGPAACTSATAVRVSTVSLRSWVSRQGQRVDLATARQAFADAMRVALRAADPRGKAARSGGIPARRPRAEQSRRLRRAACFVSYSGAWAVHLGDLPLQPWQVEEVCRAVEKARVAFVVCDVDAIGEESALRLQRRLCDRALPRPGGCDAAGHARPVALLGAARRHAAEPAHPLSRRLRSGPVDAAAQCAIRTPAHGPPKSMRRHVPPRPPEHSREALQP